MRNSERGTRNVLLWLIYLLCVLIAYGSAFPVPPSGLHCSVLSGYF